MCEELERYIDEITEEMQTKVVQLQASNIENNKTISEKDKEIARLNELVASLSKGDSRSANS